MSMLATGLPVADSPLPDFLEPYSGLRYLHKPVDLIMPNTDEHVLTNAAVRMVSQGGSDEESPMTDFTTPVQEICAGRFPLRAVSFGGSGPSRGHHFGDVCACMDFAGANWWLP